MAGKPIRKNGVESQDTISQAINKKVSEVTMRCIIDELCPALYSVLEKLEEFPTKEEFIDMAVKCCGMTATPVKPVVSKAVVKDDSDKKKCIWDLQNGP